MEEQTHFPGARGEKQKKKKNGFHISYPMSLEKCAFADKAYKFQIFSYISNIGTIPEIIKDKKRLLCVNLEQAMES